MENRRSFIKRLSALGYMTPFAQTKASQARVRLIGFLIGDVPSLIKAFRDALHRLGYVDGQNFVLEMRVAKAGLDLATQAAKLAHLDLELIVAAALPQALKVRKINPTMPMVIATCPGIISNGFATSLEHPGGNVTGMEELPPGVTAERLSLLKTAVPNVSRIALLSTTPRPRRS